jgi:hypothetical protein
MGYTLKAMPTAYPLRNRTVLESEAIAQEQLSKLSSKKTPTYQIMTTDQEKRYPYLLYGILDDIHYRGKLGSQPCYRLVSYCGDELGGYRHGV